MKAVQRPVFAVLDVLLLPSEAAYGLCLWIKSYLSAQNIFNLWMRGSAPPLLCVPLRQLPLEGLTTVLGAALPGQWVHPCVSSHSWDPAIENNVEWNRMYWQESF